MRMKNETSIYKCSKLPKSAKVIDTNRFLLWRSRCAYDVAIISLRLMHKTRLKRTNIGWAQPDTQKQTTKCSARETERERDARTASDILDYKCRKSVVFAYVNAAQHNGVLASEYNINCDERHANEFQRFAKGKRGQNEREHARESARTKGMHKLL